MCPSKFIRLGGSYERAVPEPLWVLPPAIRSRDARPGTNHHNKKDT